MSLPPFLPERIKINKTVYEEIEIAAKCQVETNRHISLVSFINRYEQTKEKLIYADILMSNQ